MAGALFLRDAKKQGFEEGFAKGSRLAKKAEKQGFEEGISQGIAQQKSEDEKLLSEERNKNKQQAERIRELEALLASRKTEKK